MKVQTNHQWRNFCYRNEVPAKVLADRFDHLSEEEGFDGFFCYRGYWYHISDFMATAGMSEVRALGKWDGYSSDSYYSGVLIRIHPDGEQYKVATYIA